MQPGTYAFRIRRGDTERLSIFLKRREVFTERMSLMPMDDKVAHWSADLPGGTVEKTTAPGGGLSYNAATGELAWPMDPALTGQFTGAIPYRLKLVDSDGAVMTWLVGTITGEG